MRRWSQLPRPLLTILAALFAVAAALYSFTWMYAVRHQNAPVELGFNPQYVDSTQALVLSVVEGSPAERAGLRVGDRVVAINGRREPAIVAVLQEIWQHGRPGDSVALTITRPGVDGTLVLHGIFRATPGPSQEGLAKTSALEVTGSFPVLFLVVGLAVLFLRLEDPNAWLLALLFGAFIAAPDLPSLQAVPAALRTFFLAYRAVFDALIAALFYFFFAAFPTCSPLNRRAPWLKWLGLLCAACLAVPGLRAGGPRIPAALVRFIGDHAAKGLELAYVYPFLVLGLVSLVANAFNRSNAEARRKSRVILWGTVVGVVPIVVEHAAADFAGFRPSFWLDTTLVILVFLFPLSFAYAVVKHRVLEIPVLLKRSARYILVQRGFVILMALMLAVVTVVATRSFARRFASRSEIALPVGITFGVVLVSAATRVQRYARKRIDRAFFRSAYDAQVILQDLAEKARTVSTRHELASLLERHIEESLHPKFLAGYLEDGEGRLTAEFGRVPPGLDTLPATLPVLAELARRGKSWDVLPEPDSNGNLAALAPLKPECLVPILGRDSRLVGLIALGEPLSEEPYSGEDKRLLDSVSNQAGVALESIRMAEKMAERMETERRAAHEMEIARQVQARLFPQNMPPLRTLDYAAGCIQARTVGGDYYDFLDLGAGRLGIVLADISGKGISGALLMANLQANLRSQYALALEDLPRLLQSVNRLFYQNTPEDRYATLFFADYDDAGRRMRYANCGHNAPLLLRADGSLERLPATTTVLGLFREWECIASEVTLHPGDTLVIYTDGVTEAANDAGQEFGEARLVEIVRSQNLAPVDSLLATVQSTVLKFSGAAQADDLTLVVARAR